MKKRKQPCSTHNNKLRTAGHEESFSTHGSKFQLSDFGDPMVSVTDVSVVVDDRQLDQIINQQKNTTTKLEQIAKIYEGLY
jgi:hypothetical protein